MFIRWLIFLDILKLTLNATPRVHVTALLSMNKKLKITQIQRNHLLQIICINCTYDSMLESIGSGTGCVSLLVWASLDLTKISQSSNAALQFTLTPKLGPISSTRLSTNPCAAINYTSVTSYTLNWSKQTINLELFKNIYTGRMTLSRLILQSQSFEISLNSWYCPKWFCYIFQHTVNSISWGHFYAIICF